MANNTSPIGVVSAVNGEVFARGVDGQMRRLALGDTLYQGDVIVTANGSSIDVAPFNAPDFSVGEQQSIAVDTQLPPADPVDVGVAAIANVTVNPEAGLDLNALLEEEAAAAGLGAGEGGGGHSFVDLARVVELVPTVGYDFPINPTGQPPQIEGEAAAAPGITVTTPTETTPTETTPTETTPTETTPTETTPTETTPTETTPTETTPTETTPTETTPTETTPTETTPTETTPTETTPTETTPTETTPTETTPTDNYGWFIPHQGTGNEAQSFALSEGDEDSRQATSTFNVQFQGRNSHLDKIAEGDTVTVVLAITGSADVNDFALDVTSNSNQFSTSYDLSDDGTALTVMMTALKDANLESAPFKVTVQALDDGVAEGAETLRFDISSASVGGVWEDNDQVQYVISDAGLEVKGSSDDDVIIGSSGDDSLLGRGGADILSGEEGDDLISGGQGDDLIDGGPGSDTLDGDAGADIFNWDRGDLGSADDPAYDTLHDFSLDDGDTLDLSSVLDGDDYNLTAVAQNGHLVLQISDVDENLVQSIALPTIEVDGHNEAEMALQAMLDADQMILKTG